ncbi:putative transcriptional regulator [Roseivirga pacifica]|uniref:Predicted transcriptional regulator n=1 Tax=Roseivirga pacifica TaxID=1267423 RepID=A0A1I0NL39_9BACT|nr:BlaI/MecI/CopY family transcriptional regulator [Roseivirga pacifica]MCO6359775.1 BlaI/MecI/CopY family transcriptional regulator [Roseivirga pacifica]MCO6367145.1 BlaI/MecI/CopY family transcriptional regulator [Roseivirga pacifica]MCO6370323.1 BlaI/MecI/CopY family transcriptional regulator [Roseivirga pacifica]MCO6374802.1 BlaI/MecI/CopY family transcriptional regulator [Roseivirga pacifica]RKQ51248.1 putative transcriptional regulator [Roseivirga pacifica]
MKELTKAEERVMQILWKLEKAFTREVVNEFKKDPPSYTTVATVLTVLEQKGFVKQEMIGNAKRYAPAISKTAYSEFTMNNVLGKYFEGSLSRLVSFFTERKDLDIDELEEIIKIIEDKKEEK